MRLHDQHKYACYALRTGMSDLGAGEEVRLADGVSATREAPVGLPGHWREWLGSLEAKRVAECDLFITATAPALQPRVLDGENAALLRRVSQIHAGLLIVTPGVRIRHGRSLSGAVDEGDADLRSTQPLDLYYAVVGASHASVISRGHLRHATAVADGLAAVQRLAGTNGYGDFGRLQRALNALYTCLGSRNLDVRLHQAVRVLEGLMSAGAENFRVVMKHRGTPLLDADPKIAGWPDALYQLRSKIEHMYGPVRAVRLAQLVSPSESDCAAMVMFARATHAAEFLAQSLLTRILSTPALWAPFSCDDGIPAFWDAADATARWGPIVGPSLETFMRTFDEAAVRRAFAERGEGPAGADA